MQSFMPLNVAAQKVRGNSKIVFTNDVKVFLASDAKIDVSQYDTILIGGSVYMGKIQKEITRFANTT